MTLHQAWPSIGKALAAAGIVFTALAPAQSRGQDNGHGFDPREIHMLPVYCKYTQIYRKHLPGGNNPEEIARYTTQMGDTFRHMHHYCWALQTQYRAEFISKTREERVANLSLSMSNYDYVIDRAPPDFYLLPEIRTKKGEGLIQLDRAGEGLLEFQRAIKQKPSYWQAYAASSDYYKANGQTTKAREWLEKGLAAAPNSPGLQRRMSELNAAKGKSRGEPQSSAER